MAYFPFLFISFQELLPVPGIVLAQAGKKHIDKSIILSILPTSKDPDCNVGKNGQP